jgi:hypothetical protein
MLRLLRLLVSLISRFCRSRRDLPLENLSPSQIAHLNELTRGLPGTDKMVRSGHTGTVENMVPMNSNDIVPIKALHRQESK